ncbi:MAG: hypothetical protein LBI15_08215 [Dysgonamonadaceae bacterium]|nr:hypothetical protein [Dysgonamonadaceae bacterium]
MHRYLSFYLRAALIYHNGNNGISTGGVIAVCSAAKYLADEHLVNCSDVCTKCFAEYFTNAYNSSRYRLYKDLLQYSAASIV